MILDYTKQLSDYYSKNDYSSAAKFLESEAMAKDNKTPAQRMTILKKSRELARWGNHVSAIINAARPEDREKLAYYFRLKSGVTSEKDADNPYLKALNSIGDKDDRKADYITYTFDDDNAYIKFKQSLGGDESTFSKERRESGFGMENGKHTYTVFKSDLIKNNVFNRINTALSNVPTKNNYSASPFGNYSVGLPSMSFRSDSYDYKGNKITSNVGLDSAQIEASNYSKEFEDLYNNIIKNSALKTSSELVSFSYKNNVHKQILDAVANNSMTQERAKFWLDENDKAIENLVMSMGLSSSNYDIYSTEPNGRTQNLFEVTNQDKLDLTEEIQKAFKEGRVTITSGAAGGRTGTILSIVGKNKEKGGIDDNKPYRTVFIPGFLDDDAKDIMESDNDAAAYVKMSECQAYGSSYELRDGGILSNFQSDGSAILNMKGGISIPIRAERVSQLMKVNEALNFGILKIQDKLIEDNFNTEGIEDYVKMFAKNLYAAYNDGKLPEDYTSATKKAEAENVIKEYTDIILGANGLK